MMKFIHIADLHLGAWKEEKLNKLLMNSFDWFIEVALKEKVDFILISGDLFNTPIPRIEIIKHVVEKFKLLNNANIKIFCIAGSHDYSTTGKTMLKVLEAANLCTMVDKINGNKVEGIFYNDVYIAGVSGKAGQTDVETFKTLNLEPKEAKLKIFMFHNSITELFPLFGGLNIDDLPKGYDYYAAGHVHVNLQRKYDNGFLVYPSSLFPVNFDELWNYDAGFYLVDFENEHLNLKRITNEIIKVEKIEIKGNFSADEINQLLLKEASSKKVKDKIVLIKIKGKLKKGSYISNIRFKDIINLLYSRGAYFVMKNTRGLEREEYENIAVKHQSEEDVVNEMIKNKSNIVPFNLNKEQKESFLKIMLDIFSLEKNPDETNDQYEQRIINELETLLKQFVNY